MLKALKKQNDLITGKSSWSSMYKSDDEYLDNEPDEERLRKDVQKAKKMVRKIDPRAKITEVEDEPPSRYLSVYSVKYQEIYDKLLVSGVLYGTMLPKKKTVYILFDIADY